MKNISRSPVLKIGNWTNRMKVHSSKHPFTNALEEKITVKETYQK